MPRANADLLKKSALNLGLVEAWLSLTSECSGYQPLAFQGCLLRAECRFRVFGTDVSLELTDLGILLRFATGNPDRAEVSHPTRRPLQ